MEFSLCPEPLKLNIHKNNYQLRSSECDSLKLVKEISCIKSMQTPCNRTGDHIVRVRLSLPKDFLNIRCQGDE
ncbi:unnamed protein product [Moneuplotes crassus]|uniref:Uncharacterized protein n=1 Tax=Euplotes crassus TaxID=5936 RepID=A0AAD1Y5X7_EUPCR|nr:unnamed protein product [Moneuplotes crassus]